MEWRARDSWNAPSDLMKYGYPIIDADRHVSEPIGMWKEYLPPELRDHAPYPVDLSAGEPFAARLARLGTQALLPVFPMPTLDGKPLYNKMSERAWLELARTAQERADRLVRIEEPEGHLEDMDREGIDIAVLYPTYALLIMGFEAIQPEIARGFARAYNRWLLDFCARAPTRLLPVALVSPHAPEFMKTEVSWAAERGFRAVVLRPNPVGGRRLSHPLYEEFWSECEQRAMGVVLHEGTHAYLPAPGADRFNSRFALHACSHPMEQMMALLDLIEGGVLECHPNLRVAFVEAGCSWLPYWLWRLDEEYAHLAGEVREHVRMKPSAYFRRQCVVTAEPDEPMLADVIRYVGEDVIVFGTDFPHLDHDDGLIEQALSLAGRVSKRALRKMLGGNAARFFGVNG